VVPWLHSSEQGVHVHDGTLASMVKRTDNNVGIRLGCCLVNGVVMVMTVDEESEKRGAVQNSTERNRSMHAMLRVQ
jgi:hypothetical protein